jgi:hypothetical protein
MSTLNLTLLNSKSFNQNKKLYILFLNIKKLKSYLPVKPDPIRVEYLMLSSLWTLLELLTNIEKGKDRKVDRAREKKTYSQIE